MKWLKTLTMLLAVAAGCASGAAHAAHVRVLVGPAYPYYYPVAPVPYYYPPVVAVPAVPDKGRRQPDRRTRTGPGTTATCRKLTTRMRRNALVGGVKCRPSQHHPIDDPGEYEMKRSAFVLLASLTCVSACTIAPTAPSVMALPGTGRTFDQFRIDDGSCRQFASGQVGGVLANQAAMASGRRGQVRHSVRLQARRSMAAVAPP
jgi:hypothetical protein